MKVGLVCPADRRRGLARDAELVAECLTGGPLRVRGRPDPAVFYHEHPPPTAEPPSSWLRFVEGVDVVWIPERFPPHAVDAALDAGARVIYVPNADWAVHGGSVQGWIDLVRGYAARGVEIWAKTARWAETLESHDVPAVAMPWIVLDPVVRDRHPATDGPVRFYANLGFGGWRKRRGADVILAAWRALAATPREATLTVKSVQELPELRELRELGVDVVVDDWSREQIRAAHTLRADVVLYPSRWEGFGLSMAEALCAGCPVVAPDAWPMSEQVVHEHNGLLVGRGVVSTMRLAPRAEPDPAELAAAMRRLIDDRPLLRRLTSPQPGEIAARQHAMRLHVRARILGEPEPRALVVSNSGRSTSGGKRSEAHWAESLARHGYNTVVATRRELPRLAIPQDADIVLVGKPTVAEVGALRTLARGAPIVCWHHDPTDLTPARLDWQISILPLVDLSFVPEGELERFDGLGAIETLMPGPKAVARRPPSSDRALVARVVFLGDAVRPETERVGVVKALVQAGVQVEVHGRRWNAIGIHGEPEVWDDDAQAIYDGRLGLSVSRWMGRLYTSNRLFNIGASGALPLVRRFVGIETLYPDGTVLAFDTPEEAVTLARDVARDPSAWEEMRVAATEHTWRHHTWDDRIGVLLERVRGVEAKPFTGRSELELASSREPSVHAGAAFAAMWDERGRKLGRRAVAHIAWDDARVEAETERWWSRFEPHLRRAVRDSDRFALDFGCGVARFTGRLAALGLDAVGVDVAPSMLELARAAEPDIRFHRLGPGGRIPLDDASVDVLWTCTVLQHIPDSEVGAVLAELRRVLAPGALVALFENIDSRRRTSASGHVVFRAPAEYLAAFPGVEEVDRWVVEREEHALFVGRLRKSRTAAWPAPLPAYLTPPPKAVAEPGLRRRRPQPRRA